MKTVLNIGLFFGLFTVVSCSSFQIPKLDNYMPPVVSIDSVFRTSGIRDGDYHALRLTKAFSMAMDSLERDSVLRFERNYALDNKVPSVYSISAILMPAKREGSTLVVPSFQGFIRDNVSTESMYCSCFGTDSRDWRCYAFDPAKRDSTDYDSFYDHIVTCHPLFSSLVPMHKLLKADNSKLTNAKSFSLDAPVQVRHKKDLAAANMLTCIVNNVLVYNHVAHDRKLITNSVAYAYHNNFLKKKSEKMKSDISIKATLTTDTDGNFELRFRIKGKGVNLKVPEPLPKSVPFNRARFLTGDYSQASYQITSFLRSMIGMNTMFDRYQ